MLIKLRLGCRKTSEPFHCELAPRKLLDSSRNARDQVFNHERTRCSDPDRSSNRSKQPSRNRIQKISDSRSTPSYCLHRRQRFQLAGLVGHRPDDNKSSIKVLSCELAKSGRIAVCLGSDKRIHQNIGFLAAAAMASGSWESSLERSERSVGVEALSRGRA